jgi:hypothetical protein
VLVEHPVSNGATDEQWRSLIRCTGVRITSKDDSKPWGPMARRDFLNWLENESPDRMPKFFDSHEAASKWLEDRNEQETSSKQSAEDVGFLRDVERAESVIHANPEISAKDLAEALGLKSAAYAQTLKVSLHAQKSAEDAQPEEGA